MNTNLAHHYDSDSCTPSCPKCEIPLTWDAGDIGDRHHPAYAASWSCDICGECWNHAGPLASEYLAADEKREHQVIEGIDPINDIERELTA